MQNTSPMHLNTSPACFEGSGTGKTRKRHKTLKHLKLAPKKQLGCVYVYEKSQSELVSDSQGLSEAASEPASLPDSTSDIVATPYD